MQKAIRAAVIFWVLCTFACTRQSEKIFNGKDLSNWNFVVENDTVPVSQVYSAEEGIITVKGELLAYMYTKRKYSDFTLELEYRWAVEASNQ